MNQVLDHQLELFRPAPDDANVAYLVKLLLESGRWVTAAQISDQVDGLWDDRQVRALASASDQVVSGQKGYKHVTHATPDEVHRFCAALESQAAAMAERAGRVRRRAHSIFG